MFLITHAATPIALAASVDLIRASKLKESFFTDSEYFILGFCALIPDIFWPDAFGPFNIGQTITHSLSFSVMTYFAILFLVWLFYKPKPFVLKAFFFWLASFTHIVWDVISGEKKLFYPFSQKIIGVRIIPIENCYLVDILLLVILVSILYVRKRRLLNNQN